MASSKVRKLWFVRRNGDVRGPFPTTAISQFLLVGRLHKFDEVSEDQQVWQAIDDIEELVSEVMKADLTDPVKRSNLEASKHGADERSGEERRHEDDPEHQEQREGERRIVDSVDKHTERQARMSQRLAEAEQKAKRQNTIMTVVLVVVCAVILGLMIFSDPDEAIPDIDCTTAPASGVNWSNCDLQGADLSAVDLSKSHIRNANLSSAVFFRANLQGVDLAYSNLGLSNLRLADMRGASLVGSNFRNSDMRGADLAGADLSYANLEGAQMVGVNLEGARLDKTIWIDGERCADGSVGGCIPLN